MLILFEKFNSTLWQLQYSLFYEEVKFKTIVLSNTGFLPPDTISLWSWLTGWDSNAINTEGKRLSSLKLREEEELGESTTNGVHILNKENQKIAYISYQNFTRKTISHITWFNKDREIVFIQYYCSEGFVFRVEYFHEGEVLETVFLNREEEIQAILYSTGEFQVFPKNSIYSKVGDFFPYFLESIQVKEWELVLYEDSPMTKDIVGHLNNPNYLLSEMYIEKLPKDSKVVVPYRNIYKEYLEGMKDNVDGKENPSITYLPFYYQSFENKGSYTDVLITTMTDKMEGLEELLKRIPWATFNIAATTEFSDKIKDLSSKYKNLKLHATPSSEKVEKLFSTNKIFLDISWGKTVYDSPVNAFSHNMLLLGIVGPSTGKYIPKESLFTDSESIINVLNYLHKDPSKLDTLIQSQKELIGKGNHGSNNWASFVRATENDTRIGNE